MYYVSSATLTDIFNSAGYVRKSFCRLLENVWETVVSPDTSISIKSISIARGDNNETPNYSLIHSTVSDVPVTSKMVKRRRVHCFNNGLHCVVRTRTLAYSSIKTPCYTASFFIRIQLFHLRNRGPNKLTYSEVGWFTWPSKGFV